MSSKSSTKKSKRRSKKKKSSKEKKTLVPLDEFDLLDGDGLNEEMKRYAHRLADIRRSRNYYQLERDQLQTLYDIVHDEVEKSESHIKNIESQMERMSESHRNDIRIYMQKIIHLEYENANNLQGVREQAEKERLNELKAYKENRDVLKTEKLVLKEKIKKEDYANEEEIKRLKEIERKEMLKLKEQFERQLSELLQSYDNRLSHLRDELNLRMKMEIHEIEERKNRHINDLLAQHEKNFNDMKKYYNSITQDNLDLIRELNNEIEDLKVAHYQNEKAMEAIEKKNETLSEPLALAEARVKNLKHKLSNYEKDKESLKLAKARFIKLEENCKSLKEELARMGEKFLSLEKERNSLYYGMEESLITIQKKANLKNNLLEKILDEYKDQFEVKKSQFTSVLRASNLDPLVLQNVTKKLDDVYSAKNDEINEKKYEIAKVTKAHNDLLRIYQAKLKEFGVPENEILLEPFIGETLAAPADLVVS